MKKKILSVVILSAVAAAAYAANYDSGRRYLFGQYFSSVLPLIVFAALSAAVLLIGRGAVCLPLCAVAGAAASICTEAYFLILPLPLLLCAHSALFRNKEKNGMLFAVSAVLSAASLIPWIIKMYRGFSLSQYDLAKNLPPLVVFFKIVCAAICVFFIFCFFRSFSFVQKNRKTEKRGTKRTGSPKRASGEGYHTFYLLSSSALLRGCVFLFVFGDKGAASTAFFAYAAFLIALYYNDDPLIRAAAGKIRSVFE